MPSAELRGEAAASAILAIEERFLAACPGASRRTKDAGDCARNNGAKAMARSSEANGGQVGKHVRRAWHAMPLRRNSNGKGARLKSEAAATFLRRGTFAALSGSGQDDGVCSGRCGAVKSKRDPSATSRARTNHGKGKIARDFAPFRCQGKQDGGPTEVAVPCRCEERSVLKLQYGSAACCCWTLLSGGGAQTLKTNRGIFTA